MRPSGFVIKFHRSRVVSSRPAFLLQPVEAIGVATALDENSFAIAIDIVNQNFDGGGVDLEVRMICQRSLRQSS